MGTIVGYGVANGASRVGEEARDVDRLLYGDLRLGQATDKVDLVSEEAVICGNFEKTKGRIPRVIVGFDEKDPHAIPCMLLGPLD